MLQVLAQGAVYVGCGMVAISAVVTAGRVTWLGAKWLGRELEKRRQRQLLMCRVPALPKRFAVRESYVAFLCAVRHLRLAWFPKDIRQLLWRHFLKDAPSAPAAQQGARVACVDAVLTCSNVPVKVLLEVHFAQLHLFVLFQEAPNKMAVLMDRILTAKKTKSQGFYAGHWVKDKMLFSKFRKDIHPEPLLELEFAPEKALAIQHAIVSAKKALRSK